MRRTQTLLTLILLISSAAQATHVPTEAAIVQDRVLGAVSIDLTSGRTADAVGRVQAILNDQTLRFVRVGDRLLSVRLWVQAQLADKPEAFVAAYEKAYGASATTALSAAERERSIFAIMRVASRYPWTQAARRAPEMAASIALQNGDVSTANALLTRIADASKRPLLQKLHELPSDSLVNAASFSAAWYQATLPALEARSVPVASKSLCVVATPGSLVALAPSGKMLWSTGPPAVVRPIGRYRDKQLEIPLPKDASLTRPLVWCDLQGTPRAVVARRIDANGSFLRAHSADDGRVLWSTADDESTRDLVMTGAPTAAGGCVFFHAVKFDAASGLHSYVGALQIVTGRLIWLVDIGETTDASPDRGRKSQIQVEGSARGIMETSNTSIEVSVDAQHVYAVLGPWVFAIDRFDGAPVWAASYPGRPLDPNQRTREQRAQNGQLYRRWRDTAVSDSTTVVIAPIDSDWVIGLDAKTGEAKWKEDGLRGDELAGTSEGRAILVGASIAALEMGTGQIAWQNAIADVDFTGPASVDGGYVGVVSPRGVMWFDTQKGLVVQRRATDIVNFDPILRQSQAKQALGLTGAVDYFDRSTR